MTNKEYEILCVIWSEGRALSAADILDNINDKTWKDSTIHSLLNKMLKNGLVFVDGVERTSQNSYSRLFNTKLNMEDYMSTHIKENPSYKKDKSVKLTGILSALIDDKDINSDTLAKLEALISEKRKELIHESDDL